MLTNQVISNEGTGSSSATTDASALTTGTLNAARLPTVDVAHGGTGATTAAGARTNLNVYSTAEADDLVASRPTAIYSGCAQSNITKSSLAYLPIGSGAPAISESSGVFVACRDGVLRNLYAHCQGNNIDGTGSSTVTVRVNGSDTSLQCSVPTGASSQAGSDTSNSATVAAGDLVSVRWSNTTITGSTTGYTTLAKFSMEFVAD